MCRCVLSHEDGDEGARPYCLVIAFCTIPSAITRRAALRSSRPSGYCDHPLASLRTVMETRFEITRSQGHEVTRSRGHEVTRSRSGLLLWESVGFRANNSSAERCGYTRIRACRCAASSRLAVDPSSGWFVMLEWYEVYIKDNSRLTRRFPITDVQQRVHNWV
jgi:hypothetical protein